MSAVLLASKLAYVSISLTYCLSTTPGCGGVLSFLLLGEVAACHCSIAHTHGVGGGGDGEL